MTVNFDDLQLKVDEDSKKKSKNVGAPRLAKRRRRVFAPFSNGCEEGCGHEGKNWIRHY